MSYPYSTSSSASPYTSWQADPFASAAPSSSAPWGDPFATPSSSSTSGAIVPSSSSSSKGGTPPKKYAVIDGVRQVSPEYKAYLASQGKAPSTALNPEKALLVISDMNQHAELNEVSMRTGQGPVKLSVATDATIDFFQEPETCRKVGLSQDAIIDALGKLFVKYEVPMGLMNKLSMLSDFDGLEFIVDDSGSMANDSDPINGVPQTRWTETQYRIKEMLEVMAYLPIPTTVIRFLNRTDRIILKRSGETPELFMQNAYRQVDKAFATRPNGGTPILRCLQESFHMGQGKKISRYLFCDGQPNDGMMGTQALQAEIEKLVKTRPSPKDNPLTLLSCTTVDAEVEWMKELEEVAPYCAECDDFRSEAEEVRRDQGYGLPFTKGVYLICQLVGAMNPDDLDALDESFPFTKWTIDNMLGLEITEQDYRKYFEGFKEAQRTRKIEGAMDRFKAGFNWDRHYNDFLRGRLARDLPIVKSYQQQLDQQSGVMASVTQAAQKAFSGSWW